LILVDRKSAFCYNTSIVRNKELEMSAMSNLSLEISDMLEAGYLPVTIARILDVPVNWVHDTANLADIDEELSPFETVNS